MIDGVRTPDVSLVRPRGWDELAVDRVDAVIAAPERPGTFRPNVVVTSLDSAEPVTTASLWALAAAPEQHPGALVVSCDVWPHAGHPGRMIVFTYPASGIEVVVMKWVWATGARHVHLTASCALHQFTALRTGLTEIASTVLFDGPA